MIESQPASKKYGGEDTLVIQPYKTPQNVWIKNILLLATTSDSVHNGNDAFIAFKRWHQRLASTKVFSFYFNFCPNL